MMYERNKLYMNFSLGNHPKLKFCSANLTKLLDYNKLISSRNLLFRFICKIIFMMYENHKFYMIFKFNMSKKTKVLTKWILD